MATNPLLILSLITSLILPITHSFLTTYNHPEETQNLLGLDFTNQKLTHFTLYWHDIVTGPSPTSVQVVKPVSPTSKTAFGEVNMIDDPLTDGPTMGSNLVGRAQGFYALASQSKIGLMMAMNFGIMEGKYNGSTFTVLGRNMATEKVREMAVVGGSGAFRLARGFVRAKTHYFDVKSGNAVVQYDCYVMHY